ncbi:hypothetical protein JOF41_002374 [Saccharothrix coeruleofusca]|uniref:hypothetical protein n=1 Tax=Saccharothrix coeruleofusca TaxID=33919 RepID=UPI001AE8EFF9|nr:hypothetical protein [Saccharothrix coeruleofusca]MBP2336196.1 hypothetical protein [Saccharothrix coeruleofusca]
MDRLSPGRNTTAQAATRADRAGIAASTTILIGTMLSLVGMSWDIQWHGDVGPDTFFTLPHLFIYAGSAIAGITSLVMVLRTTAAAKAGRSVALTAGGQAVDVLGKTFSAPLGYLVTGVAVAVFLTAGLWDQIWHTTYGFDVTIASPPHVALLLSITFTMMGAVITCAAAGRTAWGRRGFQLAVLMFVFFVLVPLLALKQFEGAVNAFHAGIAFCTALALVTAAYFLRTGRDVVAIGLIAVGVQALLWWFSPWATAEYANSVGLPLREFREPSPDVPAMLPMALLPMTAGLTALLAAGRSRGWSPARVAPLAGAAVGLVVAVTMPVQLAVVGQEPLQELGKTALTALLGVGLGALAGHLGVRFAVMLRTLEAAPAATAPSPATTGGH